ncbi:hypothetical protein [Paraburkholderia sp. GAS334]|uniref:hypothetical protein n=1 Tax=Paraburkholderia sp. GAS334 TaxID=3035131 RepID=UPI003D20AD6A
MTANTQMIADNYVCEHRSRQINQMGLVIGRPTFVHYEIAATRLDKFVCENAAPPSRLPLPSSPSRAARMGGNKHTTRDFTYMPSF